MVGGRKEWFRVESNERLYIIINVSQLIIIKNNIIIPILIKGNFLGGIQSRVNKTQCHVMTLCE